MHPARLLTVLGAALMAPAFASAQDPAALTGRWESVETSRGGIGEMLQIDAAQIITFPGALVRGTWSADSNTLTVSVPGGSPSARSFALRGDTMVAWVAGRPDSVRMVRSPGSRSREGVVGEWSYPYPGRPGVMAYETYRADSTFRLWIPFRADTIEYSTKGNSLRTRVRGVENSMSWKVTESTLELIRGVARDSTQKRSYVRERQ